jgi:hypothetical protein
VRVGIYPLARVNLRISFTENLAYFGVSGISSDMRMLRASPDPMAKEAIELFVYRIVGRSALLRRSTAVAAAASQDFEKVPTIS